MDDIRVRLEAFQGPLDLLLHLVQEAEVDIHDIPVATIADQFVKHLEQGLSTLDVDKAGEFLVMASHLLVLKSRSLLPRDEPIDEDELDPRLDLVKQLIAYKRFKDAAGALDASARASKSVTRSTAGASAGRSRSATSNQCAALSGARCESSSPASRMTASAAASPSLPARST